MNRIFRIAAVSMPLALCTTAALAEPLDVLAGRFTFNWHANPSRQKCTKIEAPLLAELKSAKFRCDLKFVTNTASGKRAQVCAEAKGRREFLIFETLRNCEDERKTQASNG